MRGKLQLICMVAFPVLVLAGIGFFLSQESTEFPSAVAPSSEPVASEPSIFASPDAQMNGFSKVDASGAYELSGLQAGDYTIVAYQVTNPNERMTFGAGQVTVGDSSTVDLDLALR